MEKVISRKETEFYENFAKNLDFVHFYWHTKGFYSDISITQSKWIKYIQEITPANRWSELKIRLSDNIYDFAKNILPQLEKDVGELQKSIVYEKCIIRDYLGNLPFDLLSFVIREDQTTTYPNNALKLLKNIENYLDKYKQTKHSIILAENKKSISEIEYTINSINKRLKEAY